MNHDLSPANLIWNPANVPGLATLALNLAIAALLSFLLGQAYVRFGLAMSNRRLFARNFLMLTVTTTLIISIVKSSLALSLGLVGALSIVRFRAAIKEPEELAYLFLAISIGLGLGASQPLVTTVAFALILALIALRHALQRGPDQPNLYLTVNSPVPGSLTPRQILDLLTQSGATASLKRFDETPETLEASFLVSFKDVRRIEDFSRLLRERSTGVRVSFVEERGLGL